MSVDGLRAAQLRVKWAMPDGSGKVTLGSNYCRRNCPPGEFTAAWALLRAWHTRCERRGAASISPPQHQSSVQRLGRTKPDSKGREPRSGRQDGSSKQRADLCRTLGVPGMYAPGVACKRGAFRKRSFDQVDDPEIRACLERARYRDLDQPVHPGRRLQESAGEGAKTRAPDARASSNRTATG